MLFFLLLQDGDEVARWHAVNVQCWGLDMELVKHRYRMMGLPIIAIARSKPKPEAEPAGYCE